MTISQNKCSALLVLIFAVIFLSSGSIIFAADEMPTFTDDDFADCKITGFEYDYSMQSQDENHSGIYVSYNGDHLQFWLDFYKNADEAKTNFQIYRDSHIKDVDLLKDLPCITILEADFTDTESTLIYYGETSSCTGEKYYVVKFAMLYADNYFSRGEFGARAADFSEQQVRDALAQMKDCIIKVINSKDRKFWGKVTNAWGEELPGMVVKLTYGGKEFETTTDENGTYRIPFAGVFGKKAQLTLVMQCRDEDQTIYFTLITNANSVTPHTVQEEFTIRTDADLKHDAVVQDTSRGTEYLGCVFRKMVAAVAIYTEILKVKPEPCLILPYADGKTLYNPQKKGIQIRGADTVYKGYNDIMCDGYIENHEYSHHIMYCMYGSKFPAPPANAQPAEKNHGGYMNPSTSDSFVEGFADFMSSVISGMVNGQTLPKISGAEDINRRAWDGCGYAEESAVTGVLWDLYDGTNPLDSDNIQLSLEEIWAVLKDYRANMYEVYKAFVEIYPDRKPEIDQVFINHGFFADKNEGNKQYDSGEPTWGRPELRDDPYIDLANPVQRDIGETIGQATNYQRLERNSEEPWPNHFIKTSTAYPFYKISFTFPEHPYLNHELYQEQQEGLIYVPVPPETYNAQIAIEGYGDDITTGNPLSFTNQEFIASYQTIIEQGYYREHDFAITGPTPVRPQTDPRRKNPSGSTCIAQKLMGSNNPDLKTLRRFRDEVLVKSSIGKQLVKIYYEKSRTVTEALEGHEFCRKIAAALLNKIIPVIEMTLT